jgi:spore coat protein A, manganese oxidase
LEQRNSKEVAMTISRRQFLRGTAIACASLALPWKFGMRSAFPLSLTQNLTKWIQPLRSLTALGDPNGIPVLSGVPDPTIPGATFYQVTIGEYSDQLHPEFANPTKLFGYFDTTNPVKRHLGGVILARRGTPVRVRFTNELPPTHILPVDSTLPGANQAHNRAAVHLHGGLVPWISDGGPFDWWDPNGVGGLSFVNGPGGVLDNIVGQPMAPGQADYYYPNDQSCRLLWYHDHAHGITRLNAYAGIATAYVILDAVNDAYVATGKIPDLPSTIPLVFQDKIFVSDTTILTDPTWFDVARPDVQVPGSLWYEDVYNPDVFEVEPGHLPLPVPSAVAEYFGDTMLANGLAYPLLTVEARRYRFLVLNACNARFLNINLLEANLANPDGIDLYPELEQEGSLFPTNPAGPPMIQIGTEGGFLLTEVKHFSPRPFNPATVSGNLILAPAERADLVIDFTGQAGKEFIMYNDAPGPFPSGHPEDDFFLGNPENPIQPLPGKGPDTRQLLRIKVVAGASDPQPAAPILNPNLVDPPLLVPTPTTVAPIPPLTPPRNVPVRNLTLNEDFDQYGRLRQLLGTALPKSRLGGDFSFGREYLDSATEVVSAGRTEVWRIFNLSADTHPIHFHLVNVQVLSRQPFRPANGIFWPVGAARGPEPNELGWKETVQMHPGEVITLIMKFLLPTNLPFTVPSSPRANRQANGLGIYTTGRRTYHEFVWHCHILEHEEHDMMRPLIVVS